MSNGFGMTRAPIAMACSTMSGVVNALMRMTGTAGTAVRMSSSLSTGHFRRTHGQSPRVLTVGAVESAP